MVVIVVAHLVCIREQILVSFYMAFLLFCITTTIILVEFLFHVHTQMLLNNEQHLHSNGVRKKNE